MKKSRVLALFLILCVIFSACSTNSNNSSIVANSEEPSILEGSFEIIDKTQKIKLQGREIEDYKIVNPSYSTLLTDVLNEAIYNLCGFELEIVDPYDFEGGPAIYLGCVDSDENHSEHLAEDDYKYSIYSRGEDIIDYYDIYAGEYAAKQFVKEFFDGREDIRVGDKKECRVIEITGSNSLQLKTEKKETVCDGITFFDRLYEDREKKPVKVYFFEIKKGSGSFYMGLPDDSDILPQKGESLTNVLKAVSRNNKNVVCGVNGDYRHNIGFAPRGLCIKEGKVLMEANGQDFFAELFDGSLVMAEDSEYQNYEGKIKTAVSGSGILIRDGIIATTDYSSEFSITRHPRTAVGIRADGSVILMVVDGRQEKFSNGASFADLIELFVSLNCENAMNLDGGGSSTIAFGDATKGFEVKNKPCYVSQRKNPNHLLVIKK